LRKSGAHLAVAMLDVSHVIALENAAAFLARESACGTRAAVQSRTDSALFPSFAVGLGMLLIVCTVHCAPCYGCALRTLAWYSLPRTLAFSVDQEDNVTYDGLYRLR
jgi:hypothetical protein